MRDVNLLIKQNVDIKKSLTLLDNIEMYNQTIDQFQEKINGFNKKLNEYYLEKNLSKYAELVEELKKITQELGEKEMLAQIKDGNVVKIEGILSEIDLKKGSFKKNGVDINSIGGVIKVRVNTKVNGTPINADRRAIGLQ